MAEIKLPKQWRHWCRKSGLRVDGSSKFGRAKTGWLYLIGRGRRWRVDINGMFQSSDNHEDFDRWANSLLFEQAMPKCEKEFMWFVNAHERLKNG